MRELLNRECLQAGKESPRTNDSCKRGVTTYEMPQGVEHVEDNVGLHDTKKVTTYEMPQGVEHVQ